MLKRTLLLTISVLCTFALAEGFRIRLAELDRARRAEYLRTFDQVRSLNYSLMKLKNIQKSVSAISSHWKNSRQKCALAESQVEISQCYKSLGEILVIGSVQQAELTTLVTSESFQTQIRKPINSTVQIENLVTRTLSALRVLLPEIQQLKAQTGQRLAMINFQIQMGQIHANQSAHRTQIQCRLMPSILRSKLSAAELDRIQGESKADAYLHLRANRLAQEVDETIAALKPSCPKANWDDTPMKAKEFLSSGPTTEQILKLAKDACLKIDNSIPEFKMACAHSDFNMVVLGSMHLLRPENQKPRGVQGEH